MKQLFTIATVIALSGLWTMPVSAQTSQRLLQELSASLSDLNCMIGGPAVEQLRRDDLVQSIEQGVEAIRERHDEDDDGVAPSLRVVAGQPRIEPGDRPTLRRGSRLIDDIWVGGGPRDTPAALVRDARNFLDAAIIDDDDDEPIAMLERAVLTQAFAYAVISRMARLCGATFGGAVGGAVATVPMPRPTREVGQVRPGEPGIVAERGQPFPPPRTLGRRSPMPRKRSWGRTGTGLGLIFAGAMLGLRQPCSVDANPGGRSFFFGRQTPGQNYSSVGAWAVAPHIDKSVWLWSADACQGHARFGIDSTWTFSRWNRFRGWWDRTEYSVHYDSLTDFGVSCDGCRLSDASFVDTIGPLETDEGLTRLYVGLGMIGTGVLLATIWSDVPDTARVAVSVAPTGGVRVSRSFGW